MCNAGDTSSHWLSQLQYHKLLRVSDLEVDLPAILLGNDLATKSIG